MLSNSRIVAVEWGHCDGGGIVFNARFFEYFDWSTALLFERALGMRTLEMFDAYGCAGIPLVETRARFLQPAKCGDRLEIVSTVLEFRNSSFDVRHQIMRDGALAVEGFETRVWVGRDPDDPGRLASRTIPKEVLVRFKA